MESAKIPHHHRHHQVVLPPLHHHHHHHHHQEQLLGSSSATASLEYNSPVAVWPTSNTILSRNSYIIGTGFDSSGNNAVALLNSRNPRLQNAILAPSSSSLSSCSNITDQDLTFKYWPPPPDSSHESHDELFSRLLKRNSCPNLSEMMSSSSPSSSIEDNVQQQVQDRPPLMSYGKNNINDPNNVKLLLSTLSSSSSGPEEELIYGAMNSCSKRGSFSQIYPTMNIAPNYLISHEDMNLRALDLLNSATSLMQEQQLGINDAHPHSNYGYDDQQLKQSMQRQPLESTKSKNLSNGVTMAEEKSWSCSNSNNTEAKAVIPKQTSTQKRSRSEASRPSCQPFKIRKEKLGDRIAALQQLVAPFGKTDTASVLMEAIGYIKFLQNQVETLSVPYLKSSRNKASRATHGGGSEVDGNNEGKKRDLKSRGLCLVPMSCLSYMTDTGGSVWPPPPSNFAGGT